jgi:hypothetical protein
VTFTNASGGTAPPVASTAAGAAAPGAAALPSATPAATPGAGEGAAGGSAVPSGYVAEGAPTGSSAWGAPAARRSCSRSSCPAQRSLVSWRVVTWLVAHRIANHSETKFAAVSREQRQPAGTRPGAYGTAPYDGTHCTALLQQAQDGLSRETGGQQSAPGGHAASRT